MRDVLKKTFAELRKDGWLARMNFTCCGTCGSYEIRQQARDKGQQNVPYVFFHQQDEAKIEEFGNVYLNYGVANSEYETRDDYDAAIKRVGDLLKAALEDRGLTVIWDGNATTRIEVILYETIFVKRLQRSIKRYTDDLAYNRSRGYPDEGHYAEWIAESEAKLEVAYTSWPHLRPEPTAEERWDALLSR